MIGAIIGDVVGSVYEFDNHKSKRFKLFKKESTFTDDTVLTTAVADFLLIERGSIGQSRLIKTIHDWVKKYPNLTYGNKFSQWIKLFEKEYYPSWKPYNSYGNGSAMRISPIADYHGTVVNGLDRNVKFITEITHNHPEGIKGAMATAEMIVMAKTVEDKNVLKLNIEDKYGYDLSRTVDELRETYQYNETCQKTVPEAMICFLESTDFEDAIRNAISIGGDSDTLAAITGSIAEAYYKHIPLDIIRQTIQRLPDDIQKVLFDFYIEAGYHYPKVRKTVLSFR